jgi:hypothetical protein
VKERPFFGKSVHFSVDDCDKRGHGGTHPEWKAVEKARVEFFEAGIFIDSGYQHRAMVMGFDSAVIP